MRKTVTDDLYVKNQVYVINQHAGYDKPTQLVMNNHDMYLENSLVIQDSVNDPINQIDWGIGTFYHTGAGLTLNANVKEFNNFIKQGTGAIILSNTIKVHGIMTFEDNTNLNMRDYAIVCDGEDKTFTIGTNSYLYSYIPDTTATTKYAFPTGFTKYSIDSTNLYYVRGDENQSILPGVEYGSVYLYDDASKEVHLHGDFTAKSNFYINYNNIVFKDNGHDLYLGGYNNDIRNYIPTDTSTMYMNGKKRQRIYSGGSDYVNINNLVISEGSHTSLIDNDNYIKGNVTIESTDTLYTAYNVYFEGSTFDNKGKFDHAARTFHFNGLNQTINPGDNSFNEVFFETGGTKTVVDTGFNIRNDLTIQGPAPETLVAVDFGALTHNIGSSLVTVFNGTWDVSNSNLVFDRNGTQYIPPITAQNVSFAVGGNKYLTDSINVNDFTVTENVYFRSSVDTESPLNFRVNGNWNVEGHFYPYGNTVYFESNNTDNKTIKSSGRSFYNVVFNSIDNQNRQYTLTNDMSLDEELTLNAGAHLKLGGKTLTLGNNDSDIPSVPMGESHIVKSGAVLEVDENAKLLFDLYDLDPSLDVYGTLRVVGNESGNATIGKSAGYTNRGIKLTAHSGSTLGFSYYSISDLNYDGFIIEDGATINPANNFSNGVWNGIYSGTQFTDPDPMSDSIYSKFYYMQIRNDVSSIGNIENVVFNHATVPVVGRHFNVFRPSGCSGTITFAGDIGGPMGIEAFEDDVNSQVIWPNITKLSWTGLVSTDWFTPGNWSPAVIPDETIDVEISKVDNIGGSNPIIYANDAVCKTLTLTNGFLTIEAGVDTVKVKKDVVLGATATLAIEDNAVIDLFGAWDIAINANFIPKKSTIFFNRTSGSSTISPRGQSFNNVEFAGGATYLLNAHNNEIVFDGDFKISSGTVKPNAINYKYSLKGDYEYVSGTFDQTVVGWFDLNGGVQNITNGRFSRLELNGTGTKTFKDSTIISYNSTSPNLYSLIVRSGVTMKLAENSTMNIEGVVFVNNGGTVDDNDQIIHYYGYYWYGYGDYIGNGFLVFKGGTQHLKGLFTNLHFKNGTTYATGDLQVKGSVILECAYYRPLDNSTSNISGSGKFEVSKNCRIIISGADNYPSGFSEYESDVTSTVFYEGTMDQIVRGNSNNIEIVYGNVTFDKGSTKTLEGDITVLRDLSFLNATTLNANDNIINIGRHWYNQKDGIFNCTQGEVVFTGSENQNIYLGGTSVNDFYKIRVNQQTTDTRVLVYQGSLTIKDKLWVRSGGFYVQDYQSVTVGGDLVASNTGTFWTYGQYILNKSVGNASIQANGSIFNQLTINGGADYTLLDDVAANGSTALSAGTLSLNGNSLTIGNGITFNIEGTLFTNPGGTVKLGNLTSLNVLNGGEIHIVGTPEYPATVTRNSGNNRYAFNVESGAKIHANYYKFEYMDLAGINIKDGAEVDVIDNFSNGTFTNPLVQGFCLQLENSQNFTGADSIANISFPVNPTNGTKNISKTVSSLGVIDIHQWSGALAGPSFENDSYNLINWKTGNTITWVGGTGGTGESGKNWNVANNWDLQRVPEPTDNVIIENTGYPCYIRNIADSVFIKSIIINGPLHLVRDADSARRVLTVDGIVEVNNPVHFSDDSTKLRFSGDFAKGASGQFMTTNGGTMEIYGVGNSSVNNSLSSDKLRLVVQKQGNVAFTTNSNQVKYLEVADGANMSLTHANGNFEVLGSFINYGVIQQGNNKFKLGSSGTYSIYPGVSIYNNIDFVAGTYNLSSPVMNVQGIVDIKAGATLNIGENSLKFGHPTLSRTLTISGSLNFSSNGSALFTNGSKVSVVSSGVLSLIGLENNEVVFSNQGGTGRYEVNINIGGKIAANHYKFEYLHANGIVLAPGSSIDSTNNFGNGIFIYGASGGRYLYFQNTIENTEITISNVNFAQGAKFNAKRESTFTGRVKFLDAYGLLAGHYYEDDDLNMTTGKIIWTYTNPTAFWTGLIDSQWDFQDNWEPKSAPNDSSILFIPAGCTNYPLLNSVTVLDTAVARRLTIYPGGSITFADGKDLSVGEDFVNGGTFTIQSGSSTHVFVGGSFANNGTFTHGGASTLELGSVNNMELSLGTATVFNLTLNSGGAGIGEFSTRSNVNVLGDLKILSGKLVVTNPAHAIYIGGDFINNTGFVHGNGTIYMNGNANKVINNANSDWFYNLALSGLGTKTLVTELKLKKDFTIGAKLVAGTNTITIQGDWKGNKIFDRGTSTVQFTGASPQFIVKSETFHNLIINNSAALSAVTLGNVVKISNNISLTKGRVESGNTNTLTILDNATMTGGSSTAYVVGYMTKIGNEDFTFPIGSDNVYAPIGISDIAGSVSTFKSVYIESGYQINQIQNGMNKVSKVEYWQLFRNAGSGEPLVTFHWNDGVRSGIDNIEPIVAAYYMPGQGWKSMGKSASTGTALAGTVTSEYKYNAFGYCTLGWEYANIEWTGNTDTNWINPDNWSEGTPSASTNVIIPTGRTNYPVLNANGVCYDLSINGGSLTIQEGNTLEALGDVVVNSGVNLNIDGQIQIAGDFTNSGTIVPGSNSVMVFNGSTPQKIDNVMARDLVLSGIGVKSAYNAITVAGNMQIASPFNALASTITISGNLNMPSGSFTRGTSSLIFNGSEAQSITSSYQFLFNNVTVNNTSGTAPQINMGANISIYGTFDLTQGIVSSSSSALLTIENTGIVNQVNHNTSFVSGPMRKVGITGFVFPLGKDSISARLAITDMSGGGYFQAEYFNNGYSTFTPLVPGLERVSTIEYWDLGRSGGVGTATPKVTLYWEDTARSQITDTASLVVAHYSSSSWRNMSGVASWNGAVGGPGSVKSAVIFDTFSPITFGSILDSENPLPVELVRFTASETTRSTVNVDWITASEYNNDRFELEKSINGVDFERIATVNSKGNSSEFSNYTYEDNAPVYGNNYYRLRQIDFDGTEKLSKIAHAFVNGEVELVSDIYPNPASDKCMIYFNQSVNQKVTVFVYNLSGTVVGAREAFLNGMKSLDISDLINGFSSGVYYVNVMTEGNVKVHKLMIK
ncbi:MAG: T9SS type A sorting domain-containing protein [Candidatus Bipolaricaulis sp.]|nr:T9SS type A sorting domain-containing protein [Candidatus Bipolaricaulis sp.]